VVDTWSGAPRAARDSAAVLADRAAHYVYVSSGSVYAPPPPLGVQESAPTVTASPDGEGGGYPELKRGAELAVIQAFGDRALVARAGSILGPTRTLAGCRGGWREWRPAARSSRPAHPISNSS
jgi:2'-hydroxyisoflavone reductase